MKYFHSKYQSVFTGSRSSMRVKSVLQGAKLEKVHEKRCKHQIKREQALLPSMIMHQDAHKVRVILRPEGGRGWVLSEAGTATILFFV